MIYASIDIETTGLDPDQDQILQVAAVIDGPRYLNEPVEELPSFVATVKWQRLHGDAFALSMHPQLLREIGSKKTTAEEPEVVGARLQLFLGNHLDDGRITAAGKNFASFDRQFIRRLWPDVVKLIHHRSLDPGSLYAKHEDRCPPSTEQCIQRLNDAHPMAPMISTKVTHDALADARLVVRLLRHKLGGRIW